MHRAKRSDGADTYPHRLATRRHLAAFLRLKFRHSPLAERHTVANYPQDLRPEQQRYAVERQSLNIQQPDEGLARYWDSYDPGNTPGFLMSQRKTAAIFFPIPVICCGAD
ncbi:hypothetical protein ACM3CZ_15945 [Edwardsiella ictaluri]